MCCDCVWFAEGVLADLEVTNDGMAAKTKWIHTIEGKMRWRKTTDMCTLLRVHSREEHGKQ